MTSSSASSAVVIADSVRIPLDLRSLEDFRSWTQSADFPETGRIDFLAGDVEVDMSPEDLYLHGVVKTAVAAVLHEWVVVPGAGNVFIDRTRLVSAGAGLSAEPDIVLVLWESIESGRVREVPAADGRRDRFVEIEGPADLVVEIVSDGSVRKDFERLPALYARAGVRELWTVDARGEDLRFEMRSLQESGAYRALVGDPGGWMSSPVLGRSVRLTRRRARLERWSYTLEDR